MKTLLLSIFLSLGIHALLMSLDTTWFKLLPTPTPHPNLITISLVAAPPRGAEKAQTPKKPPGVIEKKVKISEKKESPPSKKVVKPVPKKPAEPKQAVKPVIPPAKKILQQKPIKQETVKKENPPQKKMPPKRELLAKPVMPPVKPLPPQTLAKKEVPIKKIKPKKSLKRITKKPQKVSPVKELAQIKPLETLKPISKTESPEKKSADPQQEKTQSETPESPIQKETAPENTPRNISAALVTKGDTSAGAGLIMARPLYRKNPPPKYPRRARKKGFEGNVILEVLVDEKGAVLELKVFKSSGYEILDKSALSSVQKWLFEPGTKNGNAVKMWVRVPVRFRLK